MLGKKHRIIAASGGRTKSVITGCSKKNWMLWKYIQV